MKTNAAVTLFHSLKESFSTRCKLITSNTQADSVPIEIPLATFNDEQVVIFVEQTSEGLVIHDGGQMVDYLADHNIIVPVKRKPYDTYFHFYDDLAHKHGIRFSSEHRRFERPVEPTNGKAALIFAECLVALSFLSLTKKAGLKPFGFKDARRLSELQMTLTAAFSADIQVNPGLEPNIVQRPVRQKWGLTLRSYDRSTKGCVHYVNGADFSQIMTRAVFFNQCSEMSPRWFNIGADCHWGIYGGPPKLYEDTNAALAEIGNGSAKRLLRSTDERLLVSEITDRLGLSADKNWELEASRQRDAVSKSFFAHEPNDTQAVSGSQDGGVEQMLMPAAFEVRSSGETGFKIDSAATRVLDDPKYNPQFTRFSLDAYGLAFAERVLSEISQRPNRVSNSRFENIADTLLRYYTERNDVDATDVVDAHVAVIEQQMESPNQTNEETILREEAGTAESYVAAEIRSLRIELEKLVAAKAAG